MMYTVFSRQTESAEFAGTALGLQRQAAASMDTSTGSDVLMCSTAVNATPISSHAAHSYGLSSGAKGTLERKPTPVVIDDVALGTQTPSPRRYRRSCHGTVLDDEQQGGTDVRGSWSAVPRSANPSTDGVAFITPTIKASYDADVPAARKDVDSRYQQDQKQPQQKKGRIIHLSLSKDAAELSDSFGPYATPFAAPEIQACTCHMRYKRCKQHPNRRMEQLADRLRHLFTCGHLAAH